LGANVLKKSTNSPRSICFTSELENWVEYTKSRLSGKHSREKENKERRTSFILSLIFFRENMAYTVLLLYAHSSKNRPDLSFSTIQKMLREEEFGKYFAAVPTRN